jgi:DNA-binding PadR family transcriptional regulator
VTNADLAVLSLLSENPSHGYDLEAKIEARGMRDWTDIGFSSIYAILKKLEKKGWVEAEGARSVGQGAPRKVYRITPEGRDAQFNAVLEALSTPGRPNSSFLLGLSNLPMVPKDQALQAMGQYASALETRLTQLLTREDEQQPLPDFVQAMFDYSTAMIATELAWLNEYMQRVETQNG